MLPLEESHSSGRRPGQGPTAVLNFESTLKLSLGQTGRGI